MKRTKIRYKKLEDSIHITGIENAASRDELEELFGKTIISAYLNGTCYFRDFHGDLITGDKTQLILGLKWVVNNKVYSKEEFQERINLLKTAGDRLTKLRKEDEKSEEREILI